MFTPEDATPLSLAQTARPAFTLIHADNRAAAYRYDPSTRQWTRIAVYTTDAAQIALEALRATDSHVQVIEDGPHLLTNNGEFPETLKAIDDPTAVSVLIGEIAILRRCAESKRMDAALSDMRHDNGARELEARADALEHAITIFNKYVH